MVEPEPAGNSPPLPRFQRRGVMGMGLGRFQRFDQADPLEPGPIARLGPLARGILEPHLDRVEPQLIAQLVDHRFHRKGRHGRSGRAIGGLFGPVGHHVIAHLAHMRQVIGGKGAHGGEIRRAAGKGAALQAERALGGGQRAVLLHADPDIHRGRGGRPGGAEHLGPAHHQFYRFVGLARQRQRHRLDEHGGLAAKAATDLRGGHPQVGGFDPQKRGTGFLHDPVSLGATPQLSLAVRTQRGQAGMRFDITLVGRLGGEMILDHQVGFGKARLDIAMAAFVFAHHVGMHPLGHGIVRGPLTDHRRIHQHRLVHIGHMRQDLVVHLDQLERITRRQRRGGGNSGHRMPVIKRLVAGHDVFKDVPEITLQPRRKFHLVREIGAGDHCLHILQCLGLGGVNAQDAGMGVRAAQDGAMQHAGGMGIGTEPGAAGDLVQPVGPVRAGADKGETVGFAIVERHYTASLMSRAVSITARMILS